MNLRIFTRSFFLTFYLATTTTRITTSGLNVLDLLSASLQNVSSYPNGSYTAPISSFNQTSTNSINNTALLPLNQSVLNNINNIDNSSFIFEAGRQQNLYFRVASSVANQILPSGSSFRVAIQFGSNVANLVIVSSSGVTLLPNALPDGSRIFVLVITTPSSICSQIADSCSGLTYNTYLLLNSSELSAPISYQINVACGDVCSLSGGNASSCSASCGSTCDGQQVAGADTPVSRRYNMGAGTRSFQFIYQTYTQQDRVKVWNGATNLLDSGCVGTGGEVARNLTLTSGGGSSIRVDVEPNCAGGTGTSWYFTVVCPKN